MGIKARFTDEDVHQMMQESLQKARKAYISLLDDLGDRCVNEARINGAYQDQTGNLRSSVGYIILVDGQIIRKNFQESERGTDKKTGLATGEALAMSLAANYPKGIVLLVVAGMNYAAVVESGHAQRKKNGEIIQVQGKNVLSTAEHLAQAVLPRMIAELKSDIKHDHNS